MTASKIKLPKNICILDIETKKANFKDKEKSKLGIVGTMVYTLHKGRYLRHRYICFSPNEMNDLEKFLQRFPGIIIGHNIFGFDYAILRELIQLKGIIEKSVDTLWFIYNKRKETRGGGLDNLGRLNFGYGKTLDHNTISKLFRDGKFDEVISYNKNDLVLTKKVWWHLVKKRKILVGKSGDTYYDEPWFHTPWRDTVFVNENDISKLIGKKPAFNYKAWSSKIETGEEFLPRLLIKGGWRLRKARYLLYCKTCKRMNEIVTNLRLNRFVFSSIGCRTCHSKIGKIRINHTYVETVREYKGHFSTAVFYYDDQVYPNYANREILHWIESHPDFSKRAAGICHECFRELTLPSAFYMFGKISSNATFLCENCLESMKLFEKT